MNTQIIQVTINASRQSTVLTMMHHHHLSCEWVYQRECRVISPITIASLLLLHILKYPVQLTLNWNNVKYNKIQRKKLVWSRFPCEKQRKERGMALTERREKERKRKEPVVCILKWLIVKICIVIHFNDDSYDIFLCLLFWTAMRTIFIWVLDSTLDVLVSFSLSVEWHSSFDGLQNIVSKIVNDIASLSCRLSVALTLTRYITDDYQRWTRYVLCQYFFARSSSAFWQKKGVRHINI